jgi:short-subunit dehydrogenase
MKRILITGASSGIGASLLPLTKMLTMLLPVELMRRFAERISAAN